MSDREAGFTLLELLVSFTLLSFLLAALFGGIRFVGRAHERGSEEIAKGAILDTTREVLRRQTARAFPVMAGAPGAQRVLFTGRADRLSFPVLEPPGRGLAGLFLAVFDIEPAGEGSRLMYREYRFLPGAKVDVADQPVRTAVLAETLVRLVFAYRGVRGPESARDWLATWTSPTDLPGLIRLRSVLDPVSNDTSRSWPDLIVRLRADEMPLIAGRPSSPSAPSAAHPPLSGGGDGR
jgi:hypothetical protein